MKRIEELLREIPALERDLHAEEVNVNRTRLEKSLRMRLKSFEHLIPFSFRQELRYLCQQAGVSGEFK